MSGHSKWANIKHRKEKADAQKGAAFTKAAREIIVAVKQGGPDPEANFKLRMAIQSAKSANMPNDSITRAIKRAAGEGQNENYEEMVYEGYGPAGVAFIVEATTENRNRTASDVRYLFSKHGGNLGETGCVGWMFERKGVIEVPKASFAGSEDDLMMIQDTQEHRHIKSPPGRFSVQTRGRPRGPRRRSAGVLQLRHTGRRHGTA